jgi:Chaperone of endosialidase
MNPLIQFKTLILPRLIVSVLACFALSQTAQAQLPPPAPDGGYPNQNTAEGDFSLTHVTSGSHNTALGFAALNSNTDGSDNTATGFGALFNNTGTFNTANGVDALLSNTRGGGNTATGFSALPSNTTGAENTGIGANALFSNKNGNDNTAIGVRALMDVVGGFENIAVGDGAGVNIVNGSNNIDIGSPALEESNTIRIGSGTAATFIAGISGVAAGTDAVFVDSNGQLGVGVPSSARFKTEIKSMDKVSEAILALKPVTFRYKKDIDPKGMLRFGLVAEEVEKVDPDLVGRDAKGHVNTVRYEAVNAMLLNEFLKEHRMVQKQQKEIDALKAELKEQKALIQKVSDKVELNKPAPQTVLNQ